MNCAGAHPRGGPHRLGVGPQRARPARRPRPGDALEHREHVADQDAARRRRRVRHDHVAAVRDLERPPPDRPVGGQIGHGQRPAGRVLVVHHRPGQLARVEVVGPLGQPLDRRGQIGLADRLALGDQRPAAARRPRSPPACAAGCRGWRRGRRTARPSSRRRGRRPRPPARSRSRQGIDPKRRCTAWSPARTPGTAHAAAPMWNTCVVCSSNGTSLPARPRASLRSAGSLPARDRRERVEDVHAPRPRRAHHQEAAAARARQPRLGRPRHRRRRRRSASTAFPPCSSTRAAARAVTAWPAATAALMEQV